MILIFTIICLFFAFGCLTVSAVALSQHRRISRQLETSRRALNPQHVETEEQRLVAMHKRINNKEREAQQVLSVWREADGFIGTYDPDGRRRNGDGQLEVEVLPPTESGYERCLDCRGSGIVQDGSCDTCAMYSGPLITEPELVVSGAWAGGKSDYYTESQYLSLLRTDGSQHIEVNPHPHALSTLYEVRIPIAMDPQAAHDYANAFLKMLNEKDPHRVHFDCAFLYGPYFLGAANPVEEWRTVHWQYAKRRFEQAFIQAYALPVYAMGTEKPVAYAPGGRRRGVCGPHLGPVWDRLESQVASHFELNRDMVHDMYLQKQLHHAELERDYLREEHKQRRQQQISERQAHAARAGYEILAGRKPPLPMPDNLRAVWKAHESA